MSMSTMVPGPPEEVFDRLVDPVLHSAWAGVPSEGTAAPGGAIICRGGLISARYIELERGQRIVMDWRLAEWPSDLPPSRVEMVLKRFGKGTHLKLEQSGVPSELLGTIEQMWYEMYWDPLFEHLRSRAVY